MKNRIAALLVLIPLCLAAWWFSNTPPLLVQGKVEGKQIQVVPKLDGRVHALHVANGATVRKGQLPVSLENSDLAARLEQARVALELATEHNKLVQSACVEHICAQSNWWVTAKAMAEHAEQTASRSRGLQAAQIISLQELQDLERNLDWARSAERAAKASFDLALIVFGNDAKQAAAIILEQATRRVAELETLAAELAINSPIDDEVQDCMVQPGEFVGPRAPAVKLVDPRLLDTNAREEISK